MIKLLSLIFGSKTKAQEILLLQNKAKEVVRQGFYEQELPKIEKYCGEHKIYLAKSKFKVILADDGQYSNQGIRISEQDKRQGMYFVYFSKTEEKAWLAAYYELVRNDRDLGLLLGYPSCCVNFFCQQGKQKNFNPTHPPINMFTNLTQREKDVVLLSHFPCSSECAESVSLGKKYLEILKKEDLKRAQEIISQLSGAFF